MRLRDRLREMVQALLGHVSISTTSIYARTSTKRIREVRSPLDTPPAPAVSAIAERCDTLAHRRRELGTAASLPPCSRAFVADPAPPGLPGDLTAPLHRPSANTRTR